MKLDVMKIKMILAKKEMNQVDLAVACGVERQQINGILYRGTCSLKTLGRIAKALGVDPAEILKKEEE